MEQYALNESTPEEIKDVLKLLDSKTLLKVLLNLEPDIIKNIRDKITVTEVNKILKKLPNEMLLI